MAHSRQQPVQNVGVETSVIIFNHVLTTEVRVETTVVLAIPRRMTQAVGVNTTITASSAKRVTQSVGIEPAVVVTLPADSRVTWVSVVGSAPEHVRELKPFVRSKTVQLAEYGTLTIYSRRFFVPRGNHGHAALETVLAPGAHMKKIWADEWFSLALDGPKVMGGADIKQSNTNGVDEVQVQFAAIKTLNAVGTGYNATARRQTGTDAFGTSYVEWGIAPSLAAIGIPQEGDVLFGYGGTYAPKCVDVVPDSTVLPGRWLIRSTYRARVANTVVMRPNNLDEQYSGIDYKLVVKPRPLVVRPAQYFRSTMTWG